MKRLRAAAIAIGLSAATLAMAWGLLAGMPAQAAPPAHPLLAPGDCVVTSTLDSGPGSLRQCMLNLQAGATITFNTSIFPPSSPATIAVFSVLPDIITDAITIDASNAGVILDGSGIGTTPETLLLDDVSLTLDGEPNVIANGDFSAGLGHWRPQDDRPGATRSLTSEARSAPNAYEWSTVAHAGESSTLYDTTDTSAPLDPNTNHLNDASTLSITATGGSTVELHFWHKYGSGYTVAELYAQFTDRDAETIGQVGFGWQADWTEEVITATLPGDAIAVALKFSRTHSARGVPGLAFHDTDNCAVRGLQIVNFPGPGISLVTNAKNNRIGGSRAIGAGPLGQGNLVSGNGSDGIVIGSAGTMSNTVSGNTIGTDLSGQIVVGNAGAGVYIDQGAQYNLIGGINTSPGGACSGECNLISGNGWGGVDIEKSGTMSNTVSGNYIGTNAAGTAAIGNADSGIQIYRGASFNVIGGDAPGERNLISGNSRNGVHIGDCGTVSNTISGNYIGTNFDGSTSVGNEEDGVLIKDCARYNIVGGDMPGERNLISGNGDHGMQISGDDTLSNTVSGNIIGADVGGAAALGNAGEGVSIDNGASWNVVGGNTAGQRNLLSGNGRCGLVLASEAAHNTVIGNYIGVDASGAVALGNGWNGMAIGEGASYNTVGGTTPQERNIVSGNSDMGILILDSGTLSNTIRGNYIGTNAAGTAAIGNASNGVGIDLGASYNLVGGDTAGERNLISGNQNSGVFVQGNGSLGNVIHGNYIGTDAGGSYALPNHEQGVFVFNGASHTRIEDNLASGNSSGGILIGGTGTTDTTVSGNRIGASAAGTAAIGNSQSGIIIFSGAHDNTIGPGNIVAYNGDHGVWIGSAGGSAPIDNTITQNSIYSNTLSGIELVDGGNLELFPPILTDVTTHSVAGLAPLGSTVEIFSDDADEGRTYHGSAAAASGAFSFSQGGAFTGANVIATATDVDGNTSEFSAGYAPLVDVQVVAILQPKSGSKQGEPVTPTVKIGNAGTTQATGVSVAVSASGSALSGSYAPPAQTVNLPPLGYATLTFLALTPGAVGGYDFSATASLAGDQNPGNNLQSRAVAVASNVIDLWTRDNATDSGDIPTSAFWQSPDLWVRHTCDGGTQHQDPLAGQSNCVYLRVRNRGSAESSGADTARVYWHEPSLGIKCGDWAPIGDAQAIAATPAHTGTRLLAFSWTPTRTGHTCLQGEIVSTDDPVVNPCDIPWDNNLSQRNVDIIPGGSGLDAQAAGGIVFEVTNIKNKPKPVTLIVDVSNVPGADDDAVRLDLGSDLAARWASVDGLAKSSGIAWSGGSLVTVTAHTSGTIASIPMAASETQTVTLLVNAPSAEKTTVTIYEAIDAGPGVALADAIVGGNTYVFNTETSDIYLPVIRKQR